MTTAPRRAMLLSSRTLPFAMTSRTARLALTGFVALALPGLAAANCYSIYDAKNRLAFQSTVAPVDLSVRIGDAMRSRYPGGYLVMIPDDSDCRDFRTGGTVAPRFDAGSSIGQTQNSNEMLQASPLLRGGSTGMMVESASGREVQTGEIVRSGNVLNVRRARP